MQSMNMKKVLMGTLVCSGVLLASCADSPEVASTEAGRIRQDEFYERLKNEQSQTPGVTIGEQLLQQMLIEDILLNAFGDQVSEEDIDAEFEAMAEQYGGVETLEATIEEQGFTVDEIRDSIHVQLSLREAVRDRVEIPEEDLQELYENMAPEGTRVAHILVEDEETASGLIDELNDGADFAELVQEHSQDPGSLETDGEYELTSNMDPAFVSAALELDEGETTQEPVESSYGSGFHIIRLLEIGETAAFDDVRGDLEEQFLDEYTQANPTLIDEIFYELVQDANVQIADEDLQNAMSAFMTPPEEEEIDEDLLEELPIDEDLEESPEDTPDEEEQEEEQEDSEEEQDPDE